MAARKRDYQAEYRRRQQRAKDLGFPSYQAQRKARQRKIPPAGLPFDGRSKQGKVWRATDREGQGLRDAWSSLIAEGIKPGAKIPDLGRRIAGWSAAGVSARQFFKGWYK